MTPHVQRWITGIIAAPVVLALTYFCSEALFSGVMVAIILVAAFEYNALIFGKGFFWEKLEVLCSALLLPVAAYLGGEELLFAVLTLSVLIISLDSLSRAKTDEISLVPVSKVLFGLVYIPLMLSYFILLRKTENGVLWIFFILVLPISGDIAAFYFGRTLGKHKLYPRISPGKTVEGAIGSMAGSVVAVLLYSTFVLASMPILHALLLAVVGNCIAQLGDLFESMIKRAVGVKDSGRIMPGHGGILDRLDCLIFLVPFVYYYRIYWIP
ncbi:phosphatidate cytidylyltransferase [Syntrophus gentianae]|uniref:Phosphatidate cytidylyltransferase n=1 Tax=Syntrophus gentianae TaxID=43775 RepID=A0A1H7ZRG2_9BACT|nr:phosphatidate cytidylyltransferase [Syntrophus gentianae]SEM60866.1 phosphatidate cytidylyltransferase [Syntrophus gentianae]